MSDLVEDMKQWLLFEASDKRLIGTGAIELIEAAVERIAELEEELARLWRDEW